jgi:hypothetical protein
MAKVIYTIAHPNGKIYIGQDLTDTIDYVGRPTSQHVAQDITREQQRHVTIGKEILTEFPDDTDHREITRHEVTLIVCLSAKRSLQRPESHSQFRG